MSNQSGTCAIPALAVLMENAGVGYRAADLGRALADVSPPTLSKVLRGDELYTRRTAEKIVEPLISRITREGGHHCMNCNKIFEFNCRLTNFGEFANHLESRVENQSIDVLEILALRSQLPLEVVRAHRHRENTLPSHSVHKLLQACNSQFGQHAAGWGLFVDRFVPRDCAPPTAKLWTEINRTYVNDNCNECKPTSSQIF
jgi:hypothetical protein